MKHPSGRSFAWLIGGGLLGMTVMAISQPAPTPSTLSLGVVRPAAITEYRDKPVYTVPSSCKKLPAIVDQYEKALSSNSVALAQVGEMIDAIRSDLVSRNVGKIDQKIRAYEDRLTTIYGAEFKHQGSVEPSDVVAMYRTHQDLIIQMRRCDGDIKQQSNNH